jgi:hypothetical protein
MTFAHAGFTASAAGLRATIGAQPARRGSTSRGRASATRVEDLIVFTLPCEA